MKPSISIKIIKYGLNLLGLTWILFITDLAYALIVFRPVCDRVMEAVWHQLERLAPFYLLFLICSLGMNFLIERKLEKKKKSKEFLFLLIIEVLLLTVIAFFVSKEYCDTCYTI